MNGRDMLKRRIMKESGETEYNYGDRTITVDVSSFFIFFSSVLNQTEWNFCLLLSENMLYLVIFVQLNNWDQHYAERKQLIGNLKVLILFYMMTNDVLV